MKRPERLFYQTNKQSYNLILIYILLNILYIILYLNHMNVDIWVSYVSIVNIIILLISFLVAARIKVYDRKFQYVPIIFGIIQVFRLFTIPKEIVGKIKIILLIILIISAICCFMSSYIAIIKNNLRKKGAKGEQNGYFKI